MVVVPFSSVFFGGTPDTYQKTGLERGTATSNSTITGTTSQARLGHASAAETLDTYSHLWPDSEDRTRAAVDDVLGAGPAADSADRFLDGQKRVDG
jgi:hypothetical protein